MGRPSRSNLDLDVGPSGQCYVESVGGNADSRISVAAMRSRARRNITTSYVVRSGHRERSLEKLIA
jgi:hypothetical protein